MSSIQIFDPALCCSSGVCGTEVDQALVTFAADLAWAKEQGVAIERFNLALQPMQFAETPAVSAFLTHARGGGVAAGAGGGAGGVDRSLSGAAVSWPVMPGCLRRKRPSRGSSRAAAALAAVAAESRRTIRERLCTIF